MKICCYCKESKSLGEFYKSSNTKDRLASACKDCMKARSKAWKKTHPDRAKEQDKQWREGNRERKRELGRKSEKKCRANRYAYKRANIESINEWRRKKYAEDFEYRKKRNEGSNDWKRRNPAKVLAWNKKRKAIKAKCEGSFTGEEWLELCARHGNKCLCCGKKNVKLTVDHVIPLSKGGTNYISNIQPLCGNCNSKKGITDNDFRYSNVEQYRQIY
jgi:5-methylcytosine-specific restriction endonuclease McrA